jgi:hypothetical protein
VIERLEDRRARSAFAPVATYGEEYRDVLVPPLRKHAQAGEVRIVYVIGPGFEKFEPGALLRNAYGRAARFVHNSARTALKSHADGGGRARFHAR